MAEYIEFETTKQAIDRIRSVYHRARNFNAVSAIDNVFGEIKEIPAADVAPVVHGQWAGTVCTACGESTSFYYDCNYCPWCGAQMDEVSDGT